MIAGLLLLLSGSANAAVILKYADLCVEVDTAFEDNAGDWWTGDAPKAAGGFEYEITDANATYTGNLGSATGCLSNFPIYVEHINGTFTFKVRSKALVNGVAMESWEGEDLSPKTFVGQTWTIATGVGGAVSATKYITSLDTRWTSLLVGTMVFRQYDWNVEDPIERDCCLESAPNYALDGTCPAPATGGYGLITTPIQIQTVPPDAYGVTPGGVVAQARSGMVSTTRISPQASEPGKGSRGSSPLLTSLAT